MSAVKVKFSSQASRRVLTGFRRLAKEEGRQFQSILEEAMQEYLERHHGDTSKKRIVETFQQSVQEFD